MRGRGNWGYRGGMTIALHNIHVLQILSTLTWSHASH